MKSDCPFSHILSPEATALLRSVIDSFPSVARGFDPAQKAFEDLKDRLSSAPVLRHADYKETFYLQCYESKSGIRSIL